VLRILAKPFTAPAIRVRPAAIALALAQVGLVAALTALFEPSILAAGLALVVCTAASWCVLLFAGLGAAQKAHQSSRRLKSVRAENERPAVYDRSAGAYVDWYLRHRLDEEIARSSRYGQPFALLLIGSEAGRFPADAGGVFSSLAATFRDADLVVHLGALRFIVVLANTGPDGAKLATERLLVQLPLQDVRVGLACYPGDGATWQELLTNAGATQDDLNAVAGNDADAASTFRAAA